MIRDGGDYEMREPLDKTSGLVAWRTEISAVAFWQKLQEVTEREKSRPPRSG